MPFNHQNSDEPLSLSAKRRIDRLADEFEVAWEQHQNPRIEDFLSRVVDAERYELLKVLLEVELAVRRKRGDKPSSAEYQRRFGESDFLRQLWSVATPDPEIETQVQVCHDQAASRGEVAEQELAQLPKRIGRYRIEKLLGKGGFGLVYLAHDEKLDRRVAVKVPHGKQLSRDAKLYSDEARTVANLDHSHIAPVYDLGSTDEFPFFIVSKYVDGPDLAKWVAKNPLNYYETAELVATVAETLHYAHKQGLVHRDIKPRNILISSDRQPHVVDFGLALREEGFGKGPKYLGTPAYMSPEQARGEGHRVDGRSDVFSLGAVFYTLLTDRQPFRGETRNEVLEQVIQHEPRPPRQYDDRIPKEMERICQKAMAKRASERYSTAMDMADDLRHFLAGQTATETVGSGSASGSGLSTESDTTAAPVTTNLSDASGTSDAATGSSTASQPLRIVPKGLRSFDERDVDFFMELVPGPRDRNGLPDSIRFWKTRIEEMEADRTFRVGLIYGPSGCGKSSLVKAGLLPNLAEHVVPVYLECTAANTENSLLRLLQKVRRDVSPDDDLIGTMQALRKGWTISQKSKVVIILDQFEQWLHGQEGALDGELVRALGQCDGERLQCIVMVRDDFWLAVSRFMDHLDVDLVEGNNVWLVDLFDQRHARKVLTAFGRAYGCLPDHPTKLSSEQEHFLDRVITELSQRNTVISVRLALFAEMVKGRPWNPTTLKQVGGTEGVGRLFLEETFTGHTANPKHRQHQKAARAVLQALLPQTGTEIKGHVRSQQELQEISGYANREREFAELMQILDQETRLLTPTDPEGMTDAVALEHDQRGRYYLLTHDYLVPALREWLTSKQKETRRGRAELRLSESSAQWQGRRENRHMPNWLEFLNIWLFTRKRDWTPNQRTMMARTSLYHGARFGGLIMLLCIVFLVRNRIVADGLVSRVKDAEISSLPSIIAETEDQRRWVEPRLRGAYGSLNDDEKLRTSLVLTHWGATEPHLETVTDYLIHRANAEEVSIISRFLVDRQAAVGDRLWQVLESENNSGNERLRAACALSEIDTNSKRWTLAVREDVALRLVSVPANALGVWMRNLTQIKGILIEPLGKIMSSAEPDGFDISPWQQLLAADALAGYVADRPAVLVRYLQEAKTEQFLRMYPTVEASGNACIEPLRLALTSQSPNETGNAADRTASRQANVAVALLRMGADTGIWHLLRQSPDPGLRSYLIDRLPRLECAPEILVRQLLGESETPIRQAIMLSLGGYEPLQVPQVQREQVISHIEEWYSSDADPACVAAARWLFRRWEIADTITEFEAAIQDTTASDRKPPKHNENWWYTDGLGQTMVVIRGPVTFEMGSPMTEPDRSENETRHTVTIPRSFAVAAHQVTKMQFVSLFPELTYPPTVHRYHPEDDCPIGGVTWYEAAEYCNRLSEREGIPPEQWCYSLNGDRVRMPPDYLQRTGYRLPTEAEWEYACRAGSDTSRYYGQTSDLLTEYSWGYSNSGTRSWPVGRLKPNNFGLFDMYGNVFEWCQDRGREYPTQETTDHEDTELSVGSAERVLRGGSFQGTARELRSSCRIWRRPGPDDRNIRYGFRVARTHH